MTAIEEKNFNRIKILDKLIKDNCSQLIIIILKSIKKNLFYNTLFHV